MSTPSPLFVLRGHRSPIHTLTFCHAEAAKASAGAGASAAASAVVRATPAYRPGGTSGGASLPRLLSGDSTGQVLVWDLATRRSVAKLTAHTGPVLAVHALTDGKLVTQGKDGFVKVWDMQSSRPEPVHTIETGSYTFFKSQVIELTPNASATTATADAGERKQSDAASSISASVSYPSSPLLLLPCETASNLALYDLRVSPQTEIQLIEIEPRIPRDPVLEESFRSRLSPKEIDELDALLAAQPPQYERKVGMCMAARFFQPERDAAAGASLLPSMDRLNIAWASESGVIGVWDIRAGRHLFQQSLHKETLLSFDVSWSGRYGVSCSSSSDILAWSIDTVASKIDLLGQVNVPHEGLAEVVLRADGRLFATAGWDHRVRLFDAATLAPLAILREHTETVQCVAMPPRELMDTRTTATTEAAAPANNEEQSTPSAGSSSSGYIASGAKDGKIAVYQLYASESPTALTTPGASIVRKHEQLYAQRHPQSSSPHADPTPLTSEQPAPSTTAPGSESPQA